MPVHGVSVQRRLGRPVGLAEPPAVGAVDERAVETHVDVEAVDPIRLGHRGTQRVVGHLIVDCRRRLAEPRAGLQVGVQKALHEVIRHGVDCRDNAERRFVTRRNKSGLHRLRPIPTLCPFVSDPSGSPRSMAAERSYSILL